MVWIWALFLSILVVVVAVYSGLHIVVQFVRHMANQLKEEPESEEESQEPKNGPGRCLSVMNRIGLWFAAGIVA